MYKLTVRYMSMGDQYFNFKFPNRCLVCGNENVADLAPQNLQTSGTAITGQTTHGHVITTYTKTIKWSPGGFTCKDKHLDTKNTGRIQKIQQFAMSDFGGSKEGIRSKHFGIWTCINVFMAGLLGMMLYAGFNGGWDPEDYGFSPSAALMAVVISIGVMLACIATCYKKSVKRWAPLLTPLRTGIIFKVSLTKLPEIDYIMWFTNPDVGKQLETELNILKLAMPPIQAVVGEETTFAEYRRIYDKETRG